MPPAERAQRTAGLDGLRGLAALSVFMVHVWIYEFGAPSLPPRDGFLDFLVFEMRLAVPFFFVLSGYLLFRDFARAAVRRAGEADVWGYALRRAARILPGYYVAMLGAVLLLWGADGSDRVRLPEDGAWPLFLFFGQNYSAGSILRFNPVTWTLCLEVAFYTLLPLFGLILYRAGRGRIRRLAGMLAALIVLGVAWNALVHSTEGGIVWAKAIPAYLPYFACGMSLALWLEHRLARDGDRPRLGARATAALATSGFGIVALNGYWHASSSDPRGDALISTFTDMPTGAGFAALIAAAVVGSGPSLAWTRARPLVFVGMVSYGFYLWHVPVILFENRLGLFPDGFLSTLVFALPISLAMAALSWNLLERPLIERAARATAPGRPSRARRLEAHAAP